MNDREATAEEQRIAQQNRRRSRASGPCPHCKETDHAYYSHEDEQVVCGGCEMAGPIAETESLAWEAWIDLPRKADEPDIEAPSRRPARPHDYPERPPGTEPVS